MSILVNSSFEDAYYANFDIEWGQVRVSKSTYSESFQIYQLMILSCFDCTSHDIYYSFCKSKSFQHFFPFLSNIFNI